MMVLEIITVVLAAYVAPLLCLYMSVRGMWREFKRFQQGHGRAEVMSLYTWGFIFVLAHFTYIVKYYMLRH